MMITPEIENWLSDGGYEHHCFISYPRTPDMLECAERVKESIENDLSSLIDSPRVFLDTKLEGGAIWRKELRRALCRSVTMVALCSPVYYHPKHRMCGREWAGMSRLGARRLRDQDFHNIIPLIFRAPEHLPPSVEKFQYIDISRASLVGRSYYRTKAFRAHIREVSDRIVKVAVTISRNGAVADCGAFKLPGSSPFVNYSPAPPPESLW